VGLGGSEREERQPHEEAKHAHQPRTPRVVPERLTLTNGAVWQNLASEAAIGKERSSSRLASPVDPCHSARMRIALFEPEIAGNVGAVLRLGACLGAPWT
jgi:hypothetical protein